MVMDFCSCSVVALSLPSVTAQFYNVLPNDQTSQVKFRFILIHFGLFLLQNQLNHSFCKIAAISLLHKAWGSILISASYNILHCFKKIDVRGVTVGVGHTLPATSRRMSLPHDLMDYLCGPP